ncbi:MAG TPA: hypothetical protein VNA25_01375 [Phycisphaerae bacterium]|nr:hypothetical protein [Phycisphaerae bacterium]
MANEITAGIGESANREFWENDLELGLEPWLGLASDRNYMRGWAEDLTKRQLQVLCGSLGLDRSGRLKDQREAVLGCDGRLTPYFLVDRFNYRRSKFATADYAAAVLPAKAVEACRSGENGFDTLALLFALYREDPAHLRTVYHLEKIHSTGFARMKLKGKARRQEKTSFVEFLTPEVIERALLEFDRGENDGRTSEFKNIVLHGEHHLVFIRREEQRSMLIKSRHAIHAFKPDWVVLDFRENGRGVGISSRSTTLPVKIANRLASAYFGQRQEYANEVQVTYEQQIVKFLDRLRRDQCIDDGFTLVEVSVRNSPLDGAPGLRISSEDSESIAESIRHFEKAVAKIMDRLGLVKSIKVLYADKRVMMKFEPVEGVEQGYIVRYQDAVLNAKEREAFLSRLREEPYGLRVLSTEKQHRQRRRG